MTDTLGFHKQRPLHTRLCLADVPVKEVTAQWNAVHKLLEDRDGAVKADPIREAVWFYLTNHAMMEIARLVHDDEPLSPQMLAIVNDYHDRIMIKSLRMFYYLLAITTREARHAKKTSRLTSVWSRYPAEIKKFHESIRGVSSSPAVNRLMSHPPDVTLGVYTDFMVEQFNKGSYSSQFGGKAWGKVANCLREFVHGRITPEMMMDTAFTLAHNTGPIFNKGMLFLSQDAAALRKVLDVQRSGQIPQMVIEGNMPYLSDFQEYMKTLGKALPKFKTGYVDWYKVEALGAKGNYHYEKQEQKSKYGAPETSDNKIKEMKAKAKKIQEAKYAEEFAKTHFEVSPSLFVKKATPARSAK